MSDGSVNPARYEAAFNQIIGRVTPPLSRRLPPLLDYSPRAVEKRITQKLVQRGLPPFLRWIQQYAGDWERAALDPSSRLDLDGIRFCEGRTSVSPGLWLSSCAAFSAHWLALLLCSVRLLFRGRADPSRFTLFVGMAPSEFLYDGNDARFIEFCRQGPIDPLKRATFLIVQAPREVISTSPEFACYDRRPWFAAMARQSWTMSSFLTFLREHLRAAATFIRVAASCPPLVLLHRDFAYHGPARCLDHAGLIENVVVTCSSYNEQFLWMTDLPARRFGFHMIWYSMSNLPKIYRNDPVQAVPPDLLHMRDEHSWIWTEGQAALLREWGATGVTHVVGPILLYLPEASPRRSDGQTRVAVFDVTPISAELAAHAGRINNYYSRATMVQFIEDIITARNDVERTSGVQITLAVKPKRTYQAGHDQDYIALMRLHADKTERFDIVEPASNMFAMISGCDVVITIPYSSPAYVAAALGVPVIYYDPTNELIPAHEEMPLITFVSTREALARALRQHIAR